MLNKWNKEQIDNTLLHLIGNKDLEQRLEKKLYVVNSFNNHVNNIKEMITYFKDKNHESKKNL